MPLLKEVIDCYLGLEPAVLLHLHVTTSSGSAGRHQRTKASVHHTLGQQLCVVHVAAHDQDHQAQLH